MQKTFMKGPHVHHNATTSPSIRCARLNGETNAQVNINTTTIYSDFQLSSVSTHLLFSGEGIDEKRACCRCITSHVVASMNRVTAMNVSMASMAGRQQQAATLCNHWIIRRIEKQTSDNSKRKYTYRLNVWHGRSNVFQRCIRQSNVSAPTRRETHVSVCSIELQKHHE